MRKTLIADRGDADPRAAQAVARALIAALAAAMPWLQAQAQDLARGKLLYETQCNECHYERVHERLRSDVKDLAGLRDTVWRWSQKTKQRSFSLDELEDITQYLNASHYRFGEAAKKPR